MSLNLYVFLVSFLFVCPAPTMPPCMAYVARLAVTEVLRVAPGGVVVIAICCNSFSAMPLGERSLEVVAHGIVQSSMRC